MNIFFDNLFGKKSKTKGEVEIVTSSENKDIDTQSGKAEKWSVAYIEDLTSPIVAGSNYLTLFSTIPEVFFPIDYIASRIAGANFQLKKTKDDSIVWANKRMNGILSRPNCLMRWKELIYQHHIYKLCTGIALFVPLCLMSFLQLKNGDIAIIIGCYLLIRLL